MEHAEEVDKLDWHKLLPYVDYAHNTTKHAVTKMRPDVLVFGRKFNEFNDYSEEPIEDIDHEASVAARRISNI